MPLLPGDPYCNALAASSRSTSAVSRSRSSMGNVAGSGNPASNAQRIFRSAGNSNAPPRGTRFTLSDISPSRRSLTSTISPPSVACAHGGLFGADEELVRDSGALVPSVVEHPATVHPPQVVDPTARGVAPRRRTSVLRLFGY